jgi:membrane protein YqaA with SNARE-associated domain
MTGILQQIMDYLMANQTDPATYLLIFFLFCIAAAIILPIPIEIGLVWNPGIPFPIKALVMGLGKATGAGAVFFIGARVESAVERFSRWRWFKWLLVKSEAFVHRYGIFAMYIIMSIPGMVDTIPLYLFSIFNKRGTAIRVRDFVMANFLAGVNRAFLIYAIVELLGWDLFGRLGR